MKVNQKQEIYSVIKNITDFNSFKFNESDFTSKEKMFKSLSISPIVYNIKNNKKVFLTITNIEIIERYQQQGIFSEILSILESKEIPIMIDNIQNNVLFKYLKARGFENLKNQSLGGWTRCMYKTF